MKIESNNWFQKPNRTTVIAFVLASLFGTFLSLAAMTDFFTSSPFKSQFSMMWFIIAGSSFAVVKLMLNYLRNTK